MQRPVVRTYTLRGGDPIHVTPPGNARVSHDGGVSIWSLLLDEQGAHDVESVLDRAGIRHQVAVQHETVEQARERAILSDLPPGFPTEACASCVWMDLLLEGLCGLRGWDPELVVIVRAENPKADPDADACPLPQD